MSRHPAFLPGTSVLNAIPVISIIDDDESIRVATKNLVRSLGFRVHTFASAEDYLQSNHVEDTSCLITDVQMPGVNGIELQSLLHEQGCRTPIIFIPAFPEERTRARVMQAGAIGFLSKPFDGGTLIEYLGLALQSNTED